MTEVFHMRRLQWAVRHLLTPPSELERVLVFVASGAEECMYGSDGRLAPWQQQQKLVGSVRVIAELKGCHTFRDTEQLGVFVRVRLGAARRGAARTSRARRTRRGVAHASWLADPGQLLKR